MSDYKAELDVAIAAAEKAGRVLEAHYAEGVEAERKEDDSPVTAADLASNQILLETLREAFPDDTILSEEANDDPFRVGDPRVWIIDPLDGTRDFIAGTGDFAVLVGLAVDGQPVVGAVHRPVNRTTWYATSGGGAFEVTEAGEKRLRVSTRSELAEMKVGVTRLAMHDNLQKALDANGMAANTQQIGACIKMMALARGDIDVSLCLHGREKEWDTCAPEIIVREAGGVVTDIDGKPFRYNKPDVVHRRGILMTNGRAHQRLAAAFAPFHAE